MAKDTLNSRPPTGKTFSIAMWLLGLAAAAQIIAVGWAVVTRPPQAPSEGTVAMSNGTPPPSLPSETLEIPPTPAFPDNALRPSEETEAASTPAATTLPPMPQLIDPSDAPPPRPSEKAIGQADSPDPTAPNSGTDGPGDSGILTGPTSPAPSPILGDNVLPTPRFDGPETVPPLSTVLAEAALRSPAALVISDPAIEQMIDAGSESRASGDMLGALDQFRQAEAILPEHPRILAEIAATSQGLGMAPRAALYWERILAMGPETGGPWFEIAQAELSGERGAPMKAPPILRLGRVSAARDQTVTQGEKVVLSVTVEADPVARPNPNEMAMAVYFYDLVDGDTPEASTADTAQEFPSPPYDWRDGGRETIEVTYHQPEFTEEQQRELGERAYYGYIIELYYRDELQDTAAFPPDLKSIDLNATPTPLTEPPIGPDNSLFPTAPSDDE